MQNADAGPRLLARGVCGLESGVKETWVEEMTQIGRFEDIEAWKHARIRDQRRNRETSAMKSWKELDVWQKTHALVLRVYEVTAQFPAAERSRAEAQGRQKSDTA